MDIGYVGLVVVFLVVLLMSDSSFATYTLHFPIQDHQRYLLERHITQKSKCLLVLSRRRSSNVDVKMDERKFIGSTRATSGHTQTSVNRSLLPFRHRMRGHHSPN
jgi:hypothetical protein